jgi:OmpA-OmpF porin, OOP family
MLAETINGFEDADGCPDRSSRDRCPHPTYRSSIRERPRSSSSATIMAASKPVLDSNAILLSRYPDLALEIHGHTDADGSISYNQDLSYRRAQSVKFSLVGKGIAPERMFIRGFGRPWPVTTNATDEGKAKNRRFEFFMLRM